MLIKWVENVENGREGVFMVSHKAALIESRAERWNKHCCPPAALYSQPLPYPITIWQDLMRLFVAHCAREWFFWGGRVFKRRRLVSTQTNIFCSQAVLLYFCSVIVFGLRWWRSLTPGHSPFCFTQIWLFVMTVLNSIKVLWIQSLWTALWAVSVFNILL